jgi:predicted small lipoprotein YifL
MRRLLLLVGLLSTVGLVGCGNKGPLYLPDANDTAMTSAASISTPFS